MATQAAPASTARVPSGSLMAQFRAELARHPPFAQMDGEAIDEFLMRAEQRYYAPGEVLVEPASGVAREVFCIRKGAVTGVRGAAELSGGVIRYEQGDLFPLAAAQAERPVTATYTAAADTFVLVVPAPALAQLAGRSPAFADFLRGRALQMLELSRRALQAAYASQSVSGRSFDTPLSALGLRQPVGCLPQTPIGEVLQRMHAMRIGSMVVWDERRAVAGILTRSDVLGRVALAQVPLDRRVADVMVTPVHTLDETATAGDAALAMARHAIRHLPVLRDGAVAGVVSERDLFALQRLSLKGVGNAIQAAGDVDTLRFVARDIRELARALVGQGVQARQLTALISHLNDVLTRRLLQVVARERAFDLTRVCWLALGSEGRGEQTVATDQDNALILADASTGAHRAQALAFGKAANAALDACGFPLCRGGIMAGEERCCLPLRAWREKFAAWIEHGAPEDLLDASIFFDFRALTGDGNLATALHAEVVEAARRTPRFLKQLAGNALERRVPLNWLGAVEVDEGGGVDLKLQGTAVFVDAARIFALAWGLDAVGTRERLQGAAARIGLPGAEAGAWVSAFEFLQMLRLRVQLDARAQDANPNRIEPGALDDIDRRILRESLRVARLLQQRLRLDYGF